MVQLSHQYMTTGKTRALTIQTFVSKMMSLLFNTLSRLVTAFLPRSKHLLISWLQSPSAVILEPKKKSATLSIVSHKFAMKWRDCQTCSVLKCQCHTQENINPWSKTVPELSEYLYRLNAGHSGSTIPFQPMQVRSAWESCIENHGLSSPRKSTRRNLANSNKIFIDAQTSNDKQATTPDFVTKGHLCVIQAHCSAVGIL